MRNIYFLFLIIFSLSFSVSFAQQKCGIDEVTAERIAANPHYKAGMDNVNRMVREYIAANPASGTSFINGTLVTLYNIPCVVHVIYDNDATVGTPYNPSVAQINGALSYINQVYNGTWAGAGGTILGVGDIQVQFVLATKDPSNVATTGINRVNGGGIAGYSASGIKLNGGAGVTQLTIKNLSRWDPEKYYNIWVVNRIDGCDGYAGCGSFVAGFAYYPMDPYYSTQADMNLDGTLMLASQFVAGQKTLPHELGHMLDVAHPFQGDGEPAVNVCPSNANPLTDGDMCPDTDPINNPALAPNAPTFACRTGAVNSCTGTLYNINTESNFMNYTTCYRLFTADQKSRMLAACATSQRASLTSSWANNQGAYPATFSAPIASVTPAPISTLTSSDVAGIIAVTLNGHTVYSLNSTQDNGYLNNSGKWYNAFQLSPNSSYTMTVKLMGFVNEQLGVWIDYNNNGLFDNVTERIYFNTNIPAATALAGISINFTTPVTWAGGNNFVRIRLIEDAGTAFAPAISNVSASLLYGQAEDYAAFLTGGLVSVSLSSFTGRQAPDAINLKWNTAQEINTESFDVERSYKAGAFEPIGNVIATGAANGSEYTFRDMDVSKAGDYMYRLKIKDHGGSFTYSSILKFTVKERKTFAVLGNPFTDKLNMLLPYNNGTAAFRLTDAAGRIVYSNNVTLMGSEYLSLKIQDNLSSGLYFLEAVINGERFTQKLVK